ncbi:polysaccharide deacetylase family protein [Amycolatopsis silviterrae]|uniref:Polysaccharide deacetylase n=1 Tax=Amycolatopsis silviterrae TaxID=1656914 RepID=A0ABW5H0G3_9PSEU
MTEPWQWSERTWRDHVARVRAGRPLRPESWPGGARVAVALSFDSDHETSGLYNGQVLPGKLSQGEYGSRVGVPRLLKLLDRFGAPVTFFTPAVSALLHDGEAKSYVDAGHEIALHGWIHESNAQLPSSVERDLTFRAADALEQLSGTRPVGIRTPSWDFSEATLAIIRELGLAYDSSLMADNDCYEILADGEPTGVVELPVEWIRDDAPYFGMDRFSAQRPYTAPREVLRIWRDEFDVALAEGGLFQLTMHPHIIGHRSRIAILTELLEHIASHDGVWFATHAQVVDYVSSSPVDSRHDKGDHRG